MDYLTDIYLVTTKIAKPSVFQAKFIISVKWKCRGFLYYLQYLQMGAPFQLYDFPNKHFREMQIQGDQVEKTVTLKEEMAKVTNIEDNREIVLDSEFYPSLFREEAKAVQSGQKRQ